MEDHPEYFVLEQFKASTIGCSTKQLVTFLILDQFIIALSVVHCRESGRRVIIYVSLISDREIVPSSAPENWTVATMAVNQIVLVERHKLLLHIQRE